MVFHMKPYGISAKAKIIVIFRAIWGGTCIPTGHQKEKANQFHVSKGIAPGLGHFQGGVAGQKLIFQNILKPIRNWRKHLAGQNAPEKPWEASCPPLKAPKTGVFWCFFCYCCSCCSSCLLMPLTHFSIFFAVQLSWLKGVPTWWNRLPNKYKKHQ